MVDKVPVALILFNRPDLTRLVFSRIAQYQPQKLFLIADGPRTSDDEVKCLEARNIYSQVNWDCDVNINFSEQNLTSPIRCSSGINWVFSKVEEAIILEDDCLPDLSFFFYCQSLLEKYRDDTRVMHISGNNFQFGKRRGKYSYYFSKYVHNWGWATWRRAWENFDLKLSNWPEVKDELGLDYVFDSQLEKKYWNSIFEQCYKGQKQHWDYAWAYACWAQSGLAILPNQNLVANIGFREDATRTKDTTSYVANLPTYSIDKLTHPPYISRNIESDKYTFNKHFGGEKMKITAKLINKIKRKFLSM